MFASENMINQIQSDPDLVPPPSPPPNWQEGDRCANSNNLCG